MIIIALARPQKAEELSQRKIDVIDILMVLDISSSMLADDFPPNRLEAVKKTAKEFIKSREGTEWCSCFRWSILHSMSINYRYRGSF